jgi:hypothetical protein
MSFPFVNNDILTRSEAASYIRVCKTTLDKLIIPRIAIRRRIYYSKADRRL